MNKQTSAKDSGTGILPVVLAFSEKLDRLEAYPTTLPQRSVCRKFQRLAGRLRYDGGQS